MTDANTWGSLLETLQQDALFHDTFTCPRHTGLPVPCRVDQFDKTRTPMVTSPSGRSVVCPLLESETCDPSAVWLEHQTKARNVVLEAQGKLLGLPASLLDASFANAHENWTFVQKGQEVVQSGALSAGRIVCLLGNLQTGKSYVAACLLRRLGKEGRFEFFPTLALSLSDTTQGVKRKAIETLIEYPALVLDNVMWTPQMRIGEAVETICAARLQERRPTIITSACTWEHFAQLSPYLAQQIRPEDVYEVSERTESL